MSQNLTGIITWLKNWFYDKDEFDEIIESISIGGTITTLTLVPYAENPDGVICYEGGDSPTPTPVTVDSVSLTSTKSILSYADSESTTLSATVLDSNEDGIEGLEVSFLKGGVSIGTAITNENGVATKTYSANGDGDVSITAECESITSTSINIEDCIYYNTSEISGSSDYITISDISSLTLPNKFELSFDYKTDYESRIGLFDKTYFVSPNNPNYSVFVGTPNGSKWYYGYRATSTSTTDVTGSPTDYHTYKISRNANTFSYQRDTDTTYTKSITWFDSHNYILGMMQWGTGKTNYAKNIKLKKVN